MFFTRTEMEGPIPFEGVWRGRQYAAKQVEAYAVREPDAWLAITVVVKYFGEKGTPS